MSWAIQLSQLVLFQNHGDMQTFSKWFPKETEKYRLRGKRSGFPNNPTEIVFHSFTESIACCTFIA